MSDITKCEGHGCPAKERCYRFTAKANPERQSYFAEVPWNAETYSCQWFWEEEDK